MCVPVRFNFILFGKVNLDFAKSVRVCVDKVNQARI